MTLDKSLSLISASAIAVILASGALLTQHSERQLLQDSEFAQIDDTAAVLSTAMDQAATLSATHAEAIASDPHVADLIKAGDRQSLLDYAKSSFDHLSTGGGINVMHFHTAGMKSLLRVWEPENFGQDLSKFRPMIIAANHNRRTQKGLELGIKGLSLRAVSPVLSGSSLAGTVEIGVDLASLLQLAKATTGADFALFLDPAAVVREDGAKLDGKQRLEIEAATDTAFFGRLEEAGTVQLSRAPYLTRYPMDARVLGVMGRPLLDYSGNLVGTIVIVRDFTDLQGHLSRSFVTTAAIVICGFLIAFSLFMIVIRAFVIRPLKNLATHCLNSPGEASPSTPHSRMPEYLALHAGIENLRAEVHAAREHRGGGA